MDFDVLYEKMVGIRKIEEGDKIRNMFMELGCDKLYEEVFDARLRITEAIDKDEDGENADALCIVRAYEEMQRRLCKAAFAYGFSEGLTQANFRKE